MFQVDDVLKLTVLHRALMESKFLDDPSDKAITASPILAALMHDVVDAIIAAEETNGNAEKAQRWRDWRVADLDRREMQFVRRHIARTEKWSAWSNEERRDILHILAAPLKPTKDAIDELLGSSFESS